MFLRTATAKSTNACYDKTSRLKQELDSEHPCSDERLDAVLGEYKKSAGLTYELAHALISAIYVHGQDSIEIVWKFKDIFEDMEGKK